ncbi:MAG: LytTR family DNA-binding domain-containing protein [Syntrophomonas sp.]|uniref:LytR/AlgR family response regulator transcription factor n=1 Tax=Syntrophomonas sp. TaxID=2053627 RepID=UPI00261C2ED7|nr:LytTR family DNA-binding domain-containing protein [Syntrophomonas sp.]MDD2510439.1 LytTR family DNA-binding domain-containing protein [Syntrophomonas sp.]MDD3878888.1 LytTR family DNA-binding domain-containing protein [Syntrophomonas sp.]MDD4627438.1 LytTR family DNA-binding domain-containing protein [Syntrophomonas sp.]
MKIAICDDDSPELDRISSFIATYRQEMKVSLTYKTFQSATELLSTMSSGDYDILLLDILMPGISGMQAAHEIRAFDAGVRIIFLTSSPEFALESYAVKAYDYILKPASKDKLFSILDALIAEEQKPLEGLTVKTQTGMSRILFSKLAFVEVMNKRLYFHLADGSVQEVPASLAYFEDKLLSRPEFVKVHRSYIVNLWQVGELRSKEITTLAGNTLPISRLLYRKVREAYMEHLFVEKGVN